MGKIITIDATGIHYKILNERIKKEVENGGKKIVLNNVCGQRYIGDALKGKDVEIVINGVPGNDMAAFMDGPKIVVNGNAQDATGNTMNAGEVVIHGSAGDIVGYAMRGGRIFIKEDVGYRVGIHMKAYKGIYPVVVVGGTARDFLGEYMAGGLLVVLGISETSYSQEIVGDFVGTGMHGGCIFIRGKVEENRLGQEVRIAEPTKEELDTLKVHLADFARYFDYDLKTIMEKPFIKLYPYTHRPYGQLYAY